MEKSWIKLEIEDKVNYIGSETEGDLISTFKLFARRSDGLALFLLVEVDPRDLHLGGNPTEYFRNELAKTLATLETFRNCDCSNKKPCFIHVGENNEN